jgi:tripartite-type tricarboxylate transporter receptor subunit TctC
MAHMRAMRMAVGILIAAGMSAAAAHAAQSGTRQDYPARPVRLVSGVPGSPSDILARTIQPKMADTFGHPVVIENRSGGSGMISANIVAKAPPDGHTLLLISAQFAIGAVLNANLPFDPLKDFSGVTQLGYSTSALTVNPSLGVKTIKEFIAYAQANPGKVFFSSGGAGSSTHINAERFRYAAGIKAMHVGFKGTPEALLEVLAGRVQYCIVGLGAALPLIKNGRLIALAVSTPQRSPLLPDVPALPEVLPGFGRDGSHSLLAPAGTPRAVRERVSAEVARIFALPEVRERLESRGFHLATTTPDEHDKIIRAQIETFSKVVRMIGLKPGQP